MVSGRGPGEAGGATARAIAAAVRSGRPRASEVVEASLAGLERISALNAVIEVLGESARALAAEVDRRVAAGEDLPLAGVPIGVKDNICYAHGATTCASRMLAGYRSPFTATALERLVAAGAVPVCKTNLDEFAMGGSGETSWFGPSVNPWGGAGDGDRVCGGSSSGSAAVVAAGAVPLAIGSDTGGSVRQPASFCGVVGVKPTYGRVSRWGLVAYASSLDQIGPIAGSVGDAALALSVMGGRDERDATSSSAPMEAFEDGVRAASAGPARAGWAAGLRIGVPKFVRDAAARGVHHPVVDEALRIAAGALRGAGATIVDVDMPSAAHSVPAYYVVATAEASSNLARYDGVRYGYRARPQGPSGGGGVGADLSLEEMYVRSRTEGFGPEVRRRIMLGTYALSAGYYEAYYLRALKVRRLVKGDYDRVLGGEAGCDAVLTPASLGPAFRVGEKVDDPAAMYAEDQYTASVNMAGLPAVSVPVLLAEDGASRLPVGVQLTGRAFGEHALLRVAGALESLIGFADRASTRGDGELCATLGPGAEAGSDAQTGGAD